MNHLSERVTGGRSFCCLLTNDETLRKLNREFRQLDHPTDVLSFPQNGFDGANSLSAAPPLVGTDASAESPEKATIGELAISVERAAEQAQQFGHRLLDEVRILMLHGALHLAGMDHDRDQGEMARAERELRIEFGLPSGLIARVRR